jgi:hypothetical protein
MKKNHFLLNFKLYALLLFLICGLSNVKTCLGVTISTTSTFTSNNNFCQVTFNFQNTNCYPVTITDIATIVGTGTQQVAAYYNTTAINGFPAAITAANGWIQFGSGTITTGNGTTVAPILTGLSLIIPAGATYGITVASNSGSTLTPSLYYYTIPVAIPYTFSAAGCNLLSGTNIGYAGDFPPIAPTFYPRGFVGTVTFNDNCSGTPTAGNITPVGPLNVCAGSPTTLTLNGYCVGGGLSVQWQQSTNGGVSYSPIAGATSATYTFTPSANVMVNTVTTCANSGGTATSTAVTVNSVPIPSITLGTNPSVAFGSTSANLSYSATTGSPTQYSIVWNAAALAAGFTNVTNAALPASPIVITVPVGAAVGTYSGTVTVKNSTCTSVTYPISVIIVNTPDITLSPIPTICAGSTSGTIPYTATALNPIQYSIVWGAAATAAGFVNVTNAPLPPSPIPLTVPAGATAGTYTGTLTVSNGIVSNTGTTITVTVITLPSVTLGALPTICSGITSASLPYTNPQYNPTDYNITWSPPAIAAGFTNVVLSPLSPGSISVPVPASASGGTYSGLLTVNNICGSSTPIPFTVNVTQSTVPTISISGSSNVCAGTSVIYTANTNITGASFQWKVNGTNVGTNSNTYSYIPTNGNIITCVITMPAVGCFTANIVTSNAINMVVNPNLVPSISISGPNSGCVGISSLYTSNTNVTGGYYQWQLNGQPVGTNTSSASIAPVLGDIIKCTITVPSGACFIPTTSVSNNINVTGTLIVTPTISIYSITGTDTVCSGPSVIYLSNTNVTGGSYQWQVNGANSGFNSPAFNYTPLNGDQVLCIINAPAASCYNAPSGTSNVRTVTVIPSADPTVTVTGNNPVCQGTTVTYHASTNIIGGSYQWAVNNNPIGTNSANFTYAPVDSDYITCTITEPVYPPTGPCYTQVAATNSPFVAVVQDPTVPFIDIHAPALAPIGSTVTVTGTVTSAVGAYTIQWKNHGTTFATTSVPMVTYTKQVGKDSITAIVTPTAPGCFGSPASNYQIVNVGTATSVGNTPTKGGISVFPNPFNDHLVVSGLNINDRVCVYDLLGRKVTQVWLVETMQAEQTFNISNLPSAGYILQIWNEDGSTRESISLIKK